MKLKHIICNGLLVSALLISMVSCNKEKLSPVPQTSLSENQPFTTPERILQQVFGVYGALKSGQFLGGRGLVYNDVRGEDWLNVTGNGVTAVGVWNFSIVSSDNQVENFWSNGYAAINRANVVLEGLDANPNVIPDTRANQYRGEVRFARALAYYYLVNLYGRRPYTFDDGASPGIPIWPKANKVGTDPTEQPRATVAQVYSQILADLDFAEANLPLTYNNADSNVVRAHRNAAIALKTRAYLAMGKYANVITEANKIVPLVAPFTAPTGIPHTLAANVLTVFRTPYTSTESIFSLPMSQTSAPGTQNGLALYHNAEFALNPSGILASPQWRSVDARRTNFVTTTANIRFTKFNDDNNNYVPIIRYAEVLLILAEALARQNTGVDARALALLNAVHQRSDLANPLAPATQTELINMILTERRIELLGEGFRSPDIMRLNQTFPAKGSVSAVPNTSLSYIWPIPASELLYNKAMVPNQ